MADQPGELRRINWDECFPFTRIFKSFRMAVQPGKLGLALAGVLLMGVWGGFLDWVWPDPLNNEIGAYWQVSDIGAWRAATTQARDQAIKAQYGSSGLRLGKGPQDAPATVDKALDDIKEQYKATVAKLGDDPKAIAETANRYRAAYNDLERFGNRGIFCQFLEFEQKAVGHLLAQARSILLLDGQALARGTDTVISARYRTDEVRPAGGFGDIGMVGSLLLMARGVQWMVAEHWFFAVWFFLGSLAIWSIFGGAVCRMAALNAARDEQISPRTAIDFAVRKFFGFFSAPLLPLVMVALIGIGLWVGGLLLSVWYLGEVVGGILMVLGLVGGFVMTLILVGAVGGGGMLWPTIAVEGSDGFDGMARSYSYLASRPWRVAFYSIVATIYGAVTYCVLRYFVYFVLRLTRAFVSAGTFLTSRPGTGNPNAGKLDAMWPVPSPDNLMGDWSPMFGMCHWEPLGSIFIHLWVLLLVMTLCAYLVSFYFSASTVIYYLLRNKIDATDFDDVYVEEDEAVGAAAAPATTATSAGGTSAASAGPISPASESPA
jgi:hypothetical protein